MRERYPQHALAPETTFSEPVSQAILSTLHAMAQPLTILQSCVLLAEMPGLQKTASPDLLRDLASEVQRLSATYAHLRDLISLGGRAPALHEVNLDKALHDLAQELKSIKRLSQLHLSVVHKHSPVSVIVDQARLLHALRSVAGIAADLSPPQSRIDLVTEIKGEEPSKRGLDLTISADADTTNLNFTHQLTLVVATALLQADGAAVSITRRPLSVTISLPLAASLNPKRPPHTPSKADTTYEEHNPLGSTR